MRNDQIPTIPAIQRMNAILVAVTATVLFFLDSTAAAVGCLLGGAIVIVNLRLLSLLGAAILSAAGAGISGAAARFGAMAIPLKMLIVVGLVYLLFKRIHIDGVGFALGVLTQMTAAIIETGRASRRDAS